MRACVSHSFPAPTPRARIRFHVPFDLCRCRGDGAITSPPPPPPSPYRMSHAFVCVDKHRRCNASRFSCCCSFLVSCCAPHSLLQICGDAEVAMDSISRIVVHAMMLQRFSHVLTDYAAIGQRVENPLCDVTSVTTSATCFFGAASAQKIRKKENSRGGDRSVAVHAVLLGILSACFRAIWS